MEYADTDVKAKSPRDTSKQDQFVVVEDGVVEVDVLDTKTNRRHTHTLWPKDFVYCNERPGAHPLDSAGQFASTVALALRPVGGAAHPSARRRLLAGHVAAVHAAGQHVPSCCVPGRGRDRAFEGADPYATPSRGTRGLWLHVPSYATARARRVGWKAPTAERALKERGVRDSASAGTIAASASSARVDDGSARPPRRADSRGSAPFLAGDPPMAPSI